MSRQAGSDNVFAGGGRSVTALESGHLAKGQVVFVQSDPDDPLRIEPGVVCDDWARLRAGGGPAQVDVTIDGRRCSVTRGRVHLSEGHALRATLLGGPRGS
jgi:ferric-dicitrate binding protein FerR (iron transport regulator)